MRLLKMQSETLLKTLDALHVATCLRYGSGGFVTNDKQQARFAQQTGLRVSYLAGEFS